MKKVLLIHSSLVPSTFSLVSCCFQLHIFSCCLYFQTTLHVLKRKKERPPFYSILFSAFCTIVKKENGPT